MLQKDSRNREEDGRGGGCTSAGEATARHSRRGVITPGRRAATHPQGFIPPTSTPGCGRGL